MTQTLQGNGVAVVFGFNTTAGDYGITDSGAVLKGFMLQNLSEGVQTDLESVRALNGDVVSENFYDKRNKATLTFVISAAGRAAAIVACTVAPWSPGNFVNVTVCASNPDMVSASWVIEEGGPEITQDVTKSAEIKIPLRRRVNITAAQSV
jgi:hypothetical protein